MSQTQNRKSKNQKKRRRGGAQTRRKPIDLFHELTADVRPRSPPKSRVQKPIDLFHELTADVRPPASESKILNRRKPLPKPATNFMGRNHNRSKYNSHYSEPK